jgi:hypothetical protein
MIIKVLVFTKIITLGLKMQDLIKNITRIKKTGPGQEEGGKGPSPDGLSSTAAGYFLILFE